MLVAGSWLSCTLENEVFLPQDSSLSEGDLQSPEDQDLGSSDQSLDPAVDQAGDPAVDATWPDEGHADGPDASDGILPDGPDRSDGTADLAEDLSDAEDQQGDPQGYYPARYPDDRTHSPITAYVVDHLLDIAAVGSERNDNVFVKVGDSITQSTSYLHCFAGSHVDLGGHGELEVALDHFLAGTVEDTTPFDRDSIAAEVGRTAAWVVTGTPSPLEEEVGVASPRLAVVMFGTNDIGWYPSDFGRGFRWYSDALIDLVDRLIEAGVIPLLMSIPPRDDREDLDRWVPALNQVVRGIAQARQVPFIDFHRELMPLPAHGLGGDGVHPNVYRESGYNRPCHLTPEGLEYGYNVRNLLTLEALHRVLAAVIEGTFVPDPPGDVQSGDGSPQAPFEIDSLPFTHWADTSLSPYRRLDQYSGCSASQDESGPEYLYHLRVTEPVHLRALVVSRTSVDVDIHLLDGSAAESGCIERHHTVIDRALAAGEYVFSLDTYVSGGVELSGGYLLVVLECRADDAACQ